MSQSATRKEKKEKDVSLLYCAVLLISIIAAFFFLQPKMAALFFPQVRAARLAAFLQHTKATHQINVQEFWQFREFYSLGSFQFNHQEAEVAGGLKLPKYFSAPTVWLLSFHSPFLVSWDSAVSQSDWQRYFPQHVSPQQIVFQNSTEIIFWEHPKVLKIVFVKSITEMVSANGFFDYTPHEHEILNGHYWLNETWIY